MNTVDLMNQLDSESDLYKFLQSCPSNFTLASYVDYLAKTDGSKEAMIHVDKDNERRVFTYSDLSKKSNQVANYLQSLGVKQGDVVSLTLRNNYEFFLTVLALQKLGAIMMTNQSTSKSEQYSSSLKKAHPTLVIADDYTMVQDASHSNNVLNEVDKSLQETGLTNTVKVCTHPTSEYSSSWYDLREFETFSEEFTSVEVNPKDLGYIFCTSGTTGEPKLVMHTYDFAFAHFFTGKWYGVEEGDKHYTITDSGWAMSSWNMSAVLLNKGTLYINDYDRFNAETILRCMSEEHIDTLCAPESILVRLISCMESHPEINITLKKVSSAGERLKPETREKVERIFNPKSIEEGYGMTEMVLASVEGKETGLYDLSLGDKDEVVATSPNGGMGLYNGYLLYHTGGLWFYLNPPQDENGNTIWHTGDRGHYDGENIVCDGRFDMVKVNDVLTPITEVERILKTHPLVSECVIEPVEDPVSGYHLVAHVELVDDRITEEGKQELSNDLKTLVKTKGNNTWRPKEIVFEHIKRTPNGKIKRWPVPSPDKELSLNVIQTGDTPYIAMSDALHVYFLVNEELLVFNRITKEMKVYNPELIDGILTINGVDTTDEELMTVLNEVFGNINFNGEEIYNQTQ